MIEDSTFHYDSAVLASEPVFKSEVAKVPSFPGFLTQIPGKIQTLDKVWKSDQDAWKPCVAQPKLHEYGREVFYFPHSSGHWASHLTSFLNFLLKCFIWYMCVFRFIIFHLKVGYTVTLSLKKLIHDYYYVIRWLNKTNVLIIVLLSDVMNKKYTTVITQLNSTPIS